MTRVLVVSGIGPSESGTGRVVAHLKQYLELSAPSSRLIARGANKQGPARFYEIAFWVALLFALTKRFDSVVVLHPQTLGSQTSLWLLRHFSPNSCLMALDSGFFCVRSYNHLPNQFAPCTACLGGRFYAAEENNCDPFPSSWQNASLFVERLYPLVAEGKVKLLVQTRAQSDLARRHFGERARIETIGLWAQDFGDVEHGACEALEPPARFDVVFHGSPIEAKGVRWLLHVAQLLPSASFLIPSPRKKVAGRFGPIPNNVFCFAMSWETGLRAAVASAGITIVPSLWSAPIEGALVKSLRDGRCVGAIGLPTTYAASIPDNVLAKLDPSSTIAAEQLRRLIGHQHNEAARREWNSAFVHTNYDFAAKLIGAAKSTDV